MKTIEKIIAVVLAIVLIGLVLRLNFATSTQKYAGTTNLDSLYLTGNLTTGGSNATTTTATSQTLVASDLTSGSVIFLKPTVGSVTVTLPATSTLSTFLPNAGDSTMLIIHNATSTSGINITIAGGTGTLLKKATTTAAILPGGAAELYFYRKTDTDIQVLMDIDI